MIFSADNKVFNFSEKRLRNLFINYSAEGEQNYAKAYAAWISPLDYLSLTSTDVPAFLEKAKPLDYSKLCEERQEIFLTVDFETGCVVGHEGRHRMAALHKAGANMVAVSVCARGEKGKYNREYIERFTVRGQEFDYLVPPRKASGVVELRCLVPFSLAYKDMVRNVFGPSPALGTFIGKRIYAIEDIYQFSTGNQVDSRRQYIGTVAGFSDNKDYAKTFHNDNSFTPHYTHLYNEKNPGKYKNYAIKTSDFLKWTQEGKYIIPSFKTPALDDVISDAAKQKSNFDCSKEPFLER